MMTAKDIEEVHRAAETWRLNDERNKRLAAVKSTSVLGKHEGILPEDIFELLTK